MPAQDWEADEWIPTFVGMTAVMGRSPAFDIQQIRIKLDVIPATNTPNFILA
jgi:hypothetical protein